MNIHRSLTLACLALSVTGTAGAVPLLCRDTSVERRHISASEWAECFDAGRGRFMSFHPVGNGAGFQVTGVESQRSSSLSLPSSSWFSSPAASAWSSVKVSSSTSISSNVGLGSNSGGVQLPHDPLPPLTAGPVIPIPVVDIPKHWENPPASQPVGVPPAKNVPEPGTLALLGIAMVGAACARRSKAT